MWEQKNENVWGFLKCAFILSDNLWAKSVNQNSDLCRKNKVLQLKSMGLPNNTTCYMKICH